MTGKPVSGRSANGGGKSGCESGGTFQRSFFRRFFPRPGGPRGWGREDHERWGTKAHSIQTRGELLKSPCTAYSLDAQGSLFVNGRMISARRLSVCPGRLEGQPVLPFSGGSAGSCRRGVSLQELPVTAQVHSGRLESSQVPEVAFTGQRPKFPLESAQWQPLLLGGVPNTPVLAASTVSLRLGYIPQLTHSRASRIPTSNLLPPQNCSFPSK